MRCCQYTYCRHSFEESKSKCPVCGYPSDDSSVNNTEFAIKALPKVPVKSIIDFHQIIPNRDGMLEQQLRIMDALNIEQALLQSVPTKVTSIKSNRDLLQIKKSHSDRFLISHFMDPRHPLAQRRLRQYRTRGVRVIKLLPCLGYQPDAPRWHRFFKTMEELNQIAMIHTGFITARHKAEEQKAGIFLHSKYGQPIFFDILARKYPGIQFILCHMGGSMWVREAVEMINQHENVWGDISGSGAKALRSMIKEELPVQWNKLFWGNDSSPTAYPYNLNLLLHYLELGEKKSMVEDLLYNNAKRFIQEHLS